MSTPHDPYVRVRGAREHNLQDVSVDIPRDTLTVFTGVSGSGKSSLAFGTIYAEAQRRYFESVAPYARRLIHQVGAPAVGEVTGLPPAVSLEQRRSAPGARSSVGTVTTLSNFLRMLFSRAGDYPAGAERLDSDAFSPNTAAGACPQCHGLGLVHRTTEELLVPDPSLSVRDGAIAAWPGAWQGKNLRDVLDALGYDIDRPWGELGAEEREWILFTDEQPVVTVHPVREAGRIQRPYQGTYMSARRYVMHTFADSRSRTLRAKAERFLTSAPCPACGGSRLRPQAMAVTFAGRTIAELAALPLTSLSELLRTAGGSDTARVLTADLLARIETVTELGLGYLSLDRTAPTLSSGELQRLRLATQLRSGLFGVVYVLDEPSAGLHPADTESLLGVLGRLKEAGNSVFVVEHQMDVVRRADWLVDVGPLAGEHGGRVLHSGPPAGLAEVTESATRRFLFDEEPVPVREVRAPSGWLRLSGVDRHNVRGVDAAFPLGVFTAVTGVSGSGKSTLVGQVLAGALADRQVGAGEDPAAERPAPWCASAQGLEAVDRLVQVDQRPIGRTPRSNLATYTGLFDVVRKLFAGTETARERGYKAGRFSFNVAGGRCETCQGEGFVSVELLFLPSTYAPCPDCHGARYNPQTLEVTLRGLDIAQVLDLTVESAAGFFAGTPAAERSLRTLLDVGLGYLRLGQPATELSGGEAQRIKLATELQRTRRGHTLYLLDEPTTGLHPADVEVLMRQLHGLVDAGDTVVVVEHDMAVVAGADRVIDLGPGGGGQGGRIVAAGTPEEVSRVPQSRTAPYLRAALRRD
ncbi:excinuclease ABC subunit UvrA [Streptomyces sp. NBC_00825]|uniref:excinuclease ABC subunit UvrA n=1 Tax=unclassified Streptomyces TaxID=2593676 RepID=UPI00225C22C0|nr:MULTISPECIES: excinuclease ABC subunit UvrA [unclassified Streptomyces]WTB58658.1 excinuclease ABC subunit UvrA [Streptomyces sp. NBC_00826]WTH88465.1 excinuclease ABC subunit UvrA [Streptomyces sp. NBC_00825]WTH97194.1 excinuclease ABC subunit UvrA [Streptomyces sp. NBC_00822]MCX4862694.1 excinuclease ABC subunit UvrA [Streptomyces sp. NBC_00906]MCX4893931.1 excinuclease ABC subunit UvrA [Streptomyces sp. NBC_00892]